MLDGTMTFDTILIVDDDEASCRRLEAFCRRWYRVDVVRTAADARKALSKKGYDLLILEVCLPDGDGREILKTLLASQPDPPVVLMTSAATDVDTALHCLREGACDYLPKPYAPEALELALRRAEKLGRQLRINRRLSGLRHEAVLLGESAAAKTLKAAVVRMAAATVPVQLIGEPGTGKSAVARAIHARSENALEPFLKVNCAVGSERQLEEELFGSEDRPGVLELADGGTVLLEAIQEMPLSIQQKVFSIFREKRLLRAGRERPVQVRLIATATEELSTLAGQGRFLPDLACEFTAVKVPPLRDRLADLPQLVQHWFATEGGRFGCAGAMLSPETLGKLGEHAWKGNLAELWNALERVALTAEKGRTIPPGAFSFLLSPAGFVDDGPLLTLEEMERRHVLRALAYTNQNRTRAAGLLKISVRTLRNKLHLYRYQGIDIGECRQSELPMIAPSASKPGNKK